MHGGDPQAVAGDPDVAARGPRPGRPPVPRAPRPARGPCCHSSSSTRLCNWIRSTWSTPEPGERPLEAGPGAVAGPLPGLGGEEEVVPVPGQPRREPQLGVAVVGRHVEVVDAVGSAGPRAPRRPGPGACRDEGGGAEDDPAAPVAGASEFGLLDHGRTLRCPAVLPPLVRRPTGVDPSGLGHDGQRTEEATLGQRGCTIGPSGPASGTDGRAAMTTLMFVHGACVRDADWWWSRMTSRWPTAALPPSRCPCRAAASPATRSETCTMTSTHAAR